MKHRTIATCFLTGATLLSGCGSAGGPSSRPAGIPGNAVVIGLEQLRGGSHDLLRAISDRMPGLQVQYGGQCPELEMRGRKSVARPASPSIYVNGTHASDTCVLNMLRPDDVARVEIYPGGITRRPGYRSNSDGLILVFMKQAHQ